jgi:AcrR family transcriptional regulator
MKARSGRTATRSEIASAARTLFSERGYAGTPVRDIATEAGVDAALVIRYFGSKELLFLETMQIDLEPDSFLVGPLETLGERYIEFLLGEQDRTRNVYLALLRASDSDGVSSRLREAHNSQFVEPLRQRLTGADSELRARLAAALVGGMLYSLWVVGDEFLLAADRAELVRRYGALLQALITPS